MNVELIQGAGVQSLMADEKFAAQWSALSDRCPWGTAYQSFGFVKTWYEVYREEYQRLLMISRDAAGDLQGLLPLARSTAGRIIVAGGIHAEYQTWLSTPEMGDEFALRAVELLHRQPDSGRLAFGFLAAGSPLKWLQTPQMSGYCHFKALTRPLYQLGDGRQLDKSFKKSHTRKKLRLLGELGELSFVRIESAEEYAALFDQMACLYDLRHGAVHGTGPFCRIPHQKEFHVAMMKTPGLMHVTAMRAGNRLAAAHFGLSSRREVHLGTLVHDQALSRFSPGRLMILQLARMLKTEGFEQLDLTPGNDAYKDLLSNHADQVHQLTILPSRAKQIVFSASQNMREICRRACGAMGMTPVELRLRLQNLRKNVWMPAQLGRHTRAWLAGPEKQCVYFREVSSPAPAEVSSLVRKNHREDLLAYQPSARTRTRQKFLATMSQWIENDENLYSCVQSSRLQSVAWALVNPDAELFRRWVPDLPAPADSLLVHGLESVVERPDPKSLDLLLDRIVSDAVNLSENMKVYIVVSSRGEMERQLLEERGFSLVGVNRGRPARDRPDPAMDKNDADAVEQHA